MNAAAFAAALAAVLLAALCALADGALLSVDDDDAIADPRLRALLAGRERMHRTLSFARVVAFLAAGAGFYLAIGLAGRAPLDATIMGGVVAVLVIAIGEGLARALGDSLGGRALLRVAATAHVLEIVLAPVTLAAARVDALLQRFFPPAPRDGGEREATAEQFRQVVTAEADVSRDERALLLGVFSLGDTVVHEIMVPRVDVVGIEREMPWSEVIDRVRSSEHARFPVYDGSLDEIVGVLYAKDLLSAVVAGEPPAEGWPSLVRPAVFIPGTKPIDEQLREFKASGTHIAIVVDEYGGTAGIVTIEDVLEEIVGDIQDEYDDEDPEIELDADAQRAWVSGRLTVDELSEALGYQFEHEGVSTVGGLVYACLGRVPRAGEQFAIGGFRVVVERVVRRRIRRVYFERVEQPAERGAE